MVSAVKKSEMKMKAFIVKLVAKSGSIGSVQA